MMRLLRLKPPHGWNAVAWELAIVTLGVLIALAAQQLLSDITDRRTAFETRGEVADELNSDLMSLALRQSAEPCIDRRLTELRAILTEWEETGSFATPKWVSQSPVIEIELSRYDAALSAGRLALLSGEEQYRMGAVVARIRKFDEWQSAERVPWGGFERCSSALMRFPQTIGRRSEARSRMPRPSIMKLSSTPRRRCRWRGDLGSSRTIKAFAKWRPRSGRAASSRRRSAFQSTRRQRKRTRGW
jgi:hypothetical protein